MFEGGSVRHSVALTRTLARLLMGKIRFVMLGTCYRSELMSGSGRTQWPGKDVDVVVEYTAKRPSNTAVVWRVP